MFYRWFIPLHCPYTNDSLDIDFFLKPMSCCPSVTRSPSTRRSFDPMKHRVLFPAMVLSSCYEMKSFSVMKSLKISLFWNTHLHGKIFYKGARNQATGMAALYNLISFHSLCTWALQVRQCEGPNQHRDSLTQTTSTSYKTHEVSQEAWSCTLLASSVWCLWLLNFTQ